MDQEMEEGIVRGRDGPAEFRLNRRALISVDQIASKGEQIVMQGHRVAGLRH
jgi:hypothetical protein